MCKGAAEGPLRSTEYRAKAPATSTIHSRNTHRAYEAVLVYVRMNPTSDCNKSEEMRVNGQTVCSFEPYEEQSSWRGSSPTRSKYSSVLSRYVHVYPLQSNEERLLSSGLD